MPAAVTNGWRPRRPVTVAVLALAAAGLLAPAPARAQYARRRAQLAINEQARLRQAGCGGCRVWVTGPDSTVLHILDPRADSLPNDYRSYPTLWCHGRIGYREVVYYAARERVYARHACAAHFDLD